MIGRREFITLLGGAARVAAGGAGAAAAKLPTIGFLGARAPAIQAMDRRFCAAAARTGLDRGPHRRDRVSLGGRTLRALRRDRRRVRPAQGRCHRHDGTARSSRQSRRRRSSRSCSRRRRPGWQRLRREPGATGGNVTGLSIQSPTLLASGSNSARGVPGLRRAGDHGQCRRSAPCWRWARCRRRLARSASRSPRSKSGERRISRPPSRRSRGAQTALYVLYRPARDSPTGFESAPWRSPRGCRRLQHFANTSKPAG